jgi:hypothetical protein
MRELNRRLGRLSISETVLSTAIPVVGPGTPDPLHAMDGMPWRTPLLQAFAAGQGQSTAIRWAPLLSLAVPASCPRHTPRGRLWVWA